MNRIQSRSLDQICDCTVDIALGFLGLRALPPRNGIARIELEGLCKVGNRAVQVFLLVRSLPDMY